MQQYHITKSKKINKSCRICRHYKERTCLKFKIAISSLNNATHCTEFKKR